MDFSACQAFREIKTTGKAGGFDYAGVALFY